MVDSMIEKCERNQKSRLTMFIQSDALTVADVARLVARKYECANRPAFFNALRSHLLDLEKELAEEEG